MTCAETGIAGEGQNAFPRRFLFGEAAFALAIYRLMWYTF